MSTFGVERRKISHIYPHPNADKLELGKIEGMDFQFVIPKDAYGVGDEVLYIPVDSLVPPDILAELGLEGKLSGKEKNRVKTIRLRGEISQGIVAPLSLLETRLAGNPSPADSAGIAALLGITKYEPPMVLSQSGNLLPLPDGIGVFDIEAYDRYLDVFNMMMRENTRVVISEKLEGTNFSCGVYADGREYVNQRNYTIIEVEGQRQNVFWHVARAQGLLNAAREILKECPGAAQVTIRGELVGPGIQGNYYALKEHAVFVFDIMVDCRYLEWERFKEIADRFGLKTVPILFEGPMTDFYDGPGKENFKSTLVPSKQAEGLVVRPMAEQYSDVLGGRLILKRRSPAYLLNSEY